jgi:PAS domain S-box-containing protein
VSLRDVALFVSIVVVYVAGGAYGLSLAFVHESASAVWPPSGIAIASLLLFGLRFWPAILSAAFIVNLEPSGMAAAIGIAAGNTAEAVVAAALVQRYAGGVRAFDRAIDVFKYVLFAVMAAPALSATIGIVSLLVTGRADPASAAVIWMTWWIGDAIGASVIAPSLILWGSAPRPSWEFDRLAEGALIGLVVTFVALVVFAAWLPGAGSHYALEFVCIPPCLWAAFRFGPRGGATAALLLSAIAIWGTLDGLGPFGRETPQNALPLLQAFVGVVAFTSLTVGALAVESRSANQQIRALNAELEERVRDRTALLLQSEARLLEAQQVGHIGSWEWEIDGDGIWWSDELCRIYGVDPAAVPPTYHAFLSLVHPDDRPTIERHVRGILERGETFDFHHRVIRPDGAQRWLHARARLVRGAGGKPVRLAGTALDITAWKAVEAERARMADAEAARRAAEDANRQKDEFLAVLSHELRSPLNAVLGWLQVLRTKSLDADVARMVEIVERNGVALRRIIDDLLDLSAIISGKLRLETVGINLDAELRSSVESIRPHADSRRIDLVYEPCADPLVIEADPHRLHQVLSNLLTNSVKFTPAGGRVVLACWQDGTDAVLTIADTGIGVAADAQPFIFDPFRQADSSLTRGHGGLGLGLAIARHLVDLHGGSIRVESAGEHQGTTFTVRLPIAAIADPEPVPAPPASVAHSSASLLSGRRVVVIDDDPDARHLLKIGLEAAGATVATADSAAQGLSRVTELLPDVVVVDISMPETDGFAFLRQLRVAGHAVPAVAVTAHAARHDRQRALEAGFHEHVAKPVDLDHLVRTLALFTVA